MHVDDEDKNLNDKTSPSFGQRGTTIVNEYGFYSPVLTSRMPNAKKFKRWYNSLQMWTFDVKLTPENMHEFVEKIVVYASDKSSGHRTQQIDICFRFSVMTATVTADSVVYDKKRKAA